MMQPGSNTLIRKKKQLEKKKTAQKIIEQNTWNKRQEISGNTFGTQAFCSIKYVL